MITLMESPVKNAGGNIMLRKIVRFIIALVLLVPSAIIFIPVFSFLDWIAGFEDNSARDITNWLVSWLTFKDF